MITSPDMELLPDGELAGARPPGVADEPALVPGQHAVLHPGPIHPDLQHDLVTAVTACMTAS